MSTATKEKKPKDKMLFFMGLDCVGFGLLCVCELPEQNVGDDEDCGCDETAADCHECHKCLFKFGFHGFMWFGLLGFVSNLVQALRKGLGVASEKKRKVCASGERMVSHQALC